MPDINVHVCRKNNTSWVEYSKNSGWYQMKAIFAHMQNTLIILDTLYIKVTMWTKYNDAFN